MRRSILYILFFICAPGLAPAQSRIASSSPQDPARSVLWHGVERSLRYHPEGGDFVIVNGERRFNRALYGTNTAFRVEGGDRPEFALYMPGMGGNLKFGLINGDRSKWLIDAGSIRTAYRPGSLLYDIRDPLLGAGTLHITVLAMVASEGLVLRLSSEEVDPAAHLLCVFGGASGKKFSRDGDIGADPESSFYLQPGYCAGNRFHIEGNRFVLSYGAGRSLEGLFPASSGLKLADAASQASPLELSKSSPAAAPIVMTDLPANAVAAYYFLIRNPDPHNLSAVPGDLSADPAGIRLSEIKPAVLFQQAEQARDSLAGRIRVKTPDPYINTLGAALSVAADGIWESPSYLHGAIAWRIRLPGWRGPYVADPLGWHDRARMHFSGYAMSQLIVPPDGPVVFDTALHLARQLEKVGTAMFSSGYICRDPGGQFRPNHYDMNLVFVDALLNHFNWTGDTAYVRKMWPLLQRHLAWEKRNFDPDGDGLYDAYCCIWASDALEYSGGGVTHSSAYNYRANRLAAGLASLIGEDPAPYRVEADKIEHAINAQLWMPDSGSYAEYLDRPVKGRRILHPSAGLWTIYHSIDSKLPDPFQAYQSLRYVDTHIPHIPVRATGLADTTLYTLATTNWLPYAWSLNNVVMAESLHTALAYWQAGRPETAFPLWKGALVESMYLGASPGNFQQLSFYDAMKGELYRDFADPIGMAARSLIEGLFGIHPDALHDTLTIDPGWPMDWPAASLHTPDLILEYSRTGDTDRYEIGVLFSRKMNLRLGVRARSDEVRAVLVNGQPAQWIARPGAVNHPMMELNLPPEAAWHIDVVWQGNPIETAPAPVMWATGQRVELSFQPAAILACSDPQASIRDVHVGQHALMFSVNNREGDKAFFVRLAQGAFSWWQPVCFRSVAPIVLDASANPIRIFNNTDSALSGKIVVDYNADGDPVPTALIRPRSSLVMSLPARLLKPGHNSIRYEGPDGMSAQATLSDWSPPGASPHRYESIDLSRQFNDKVTNIFRHEYLSPRPLFPTLQLPWQGIGNWCYPLVGPVIDDAGLRTKAGHKGQIVLPEGIPLATPGKPAVPNIVFTSRWDNFPDTASIPLTGKASHAWFLLAGSTNPMQSRITNGTITVYYADGSSDELALDNPGSWWPIEQDYYEDGFAFSSGAPRPLRVYLKSGGVGDSEPGRSSIKGFSDTGIDGGAAVVMDMPLHPDRVLDRLVLRTTANDVVIGLMSLTLLRK